MSFVVSILLVAGFVIVAFHYCKQLTKDGPSATQREFLIWVSKGVVAPVFLWILFNSGVLMSPLLPEIEMASGGGRRISTLLTKTAPGLLVIGSYWAALTFGSLLVAIWRRLETRQAFVDHIVVWSVLMLPLAGLILYGTNWAWAGFALFVWFWPILHSAIQLVPAKKIPPTYSTAMAKMQFGKFQEAEWAVIRQLEECEDDFQGWIMLAELYANHFHDLPAAEQTILETCAQPNVHPSQVAVALHHLADWHLKLADDPVAARRALEGIGQRFPGTHLDRMARQRLDRLPASREELRERRQSKPIHLPALNDGLDETSEQHVPPGTRNEAAAQAREWVEKLKRNPDDVPAREELARTFAEQLQRPDWAVEQLELLMQMPGQPGRKAAEWLSLVAAWQIKYLGDLEAARKTLERLIREYPQSAQAFAAQRRINLMNSELKLRQARLPANPSLPSSAGLGAANGRKSGSYKTQSQK